MSKKPAQNSIQWTKALVHAAALDAGNRSMKRHGRTAWNEDDRNAACALYDQFEPIVWIDMPDR